jgi:hypothetical protein
MLVAWENICRMEKSRKNRGCRRILAEVEKSYQRYNNQAGFVEILGSPPGFQHIGGSWYIYIYLFLFYLFIFYIFSDFFNVHYRGWDTTAKNLGLARLVLVMR